MGGGIAILLGASMEKPLSKNGHPFAARRVRPVTRLWPALECSLAHRAEAGENQKVDGALAQ
jgi:hypothetical protein